jgi:hypothetical protein
MGAEGLIEKGFVFAGTCNCGGGFNKKYKRGEWLVYVTASKFKVKKNGSTVKGYSPIEGLEKYLEKALPAIFAGKQVQGNTSF